jgi:YD repeat-containing protein
LDRAKLREQVFAELERMVEEVADASFGTSGGVGDRLHRVEKLRSNHYNGSQEDVTEYAYSGAGRLVKTTLSVPGVTSAYDISTGTDGNYEALDRWGRTLTKDWRASSTLKDQFNYTYDDAGNPLSREIPSSLYATDDKDYGYTYDGLDRLETADRGTWSGSAITSGTLDLDWGLDALGNWETYDVDMASQTRDHNNANEVAAIDSSSTNVAHDAAGNMTTIPQPDGSGNYSLTYDAWNRLVKVADGMTTVATYEYDGLNRRIEADDDDFYYSDSWQVLEQHANNDSAYVWHPYYVDALAVRLWDGDDDGNYTDADETHYALHDANFNVTALINRSGTVIERYEYTPYGELTVLDADFTDDSDGGDGLSDVANPYTYTGRR